MIAVGGGFHVQIGLVSFDTASMPTCSGVAGSPVQILAVKKSPAGSGQYASVKEVDNALGRRWPFPSRWPGS
jgi:hypothetical protein